MTDNTAEGGTTATIEPEGALAIRQRANIPMLERWVEENADLAIRKMEALIDALDRVRKLSIKSTYPSDWVIHVSKDADGNILRQIGYLQDCGAERAAKPWGIEVSAPAIEREDHDADGTYSYHMIAEARCKLTGETAEVSGSRWSGDGFFARREDGPSAKVDPTDVRKAAYANLHGRAVRALAGLNAVPIEKLTEAGIDPTKVVTVGYGKGAQGGQSTGAQVGAADYVIPWGNSRGKKAGELEDKDLDYYIKAGERDLADPAKEKFKKNTERGLTALRAEKERRARAAEQEQETGTKAAAPAQAEAPAADPDAPTPRGKMVGELWKLLNDLAGGDQKLVMTGIRRLTAEHIEKEKGSLTDLTDDELRKLHGIPANILKAFVDTIAKQ